MPITPEEAQRELHRAKANGLYDLLHASAAAHGLDFALVLAVASRETNLVNELGDGQHGVGPMQLDVRSWPLAKRMRDDGTWRTHPGPLIDQCCALLAANIRWAQGYVQAPDDAARMAAAAYNAGRSNALKGHQQGDCDRFTTGMDYGSDVLKRRDVFAALLAG